MEKISKKTLIILVIYIISLIIFNMHIEQYQSYIKEFPDEYSHIAYIAYLEKTKKLVPNFKAMQEIEEQSIHLRKNSKEIDKEKDTTNEEMEEKTTGFLDGTVNHLGHPPLYYHIMRIFGLVKVDNEIITYNRSKLRMVSQIISNIALIIAFVIAYRNLKSIRANFVYSLVLVNIPLLPYVSGAVSNDVLSFLGMNIFLLGALELTKQNRNIWTYIFLAMGTFICMMNKVTAGLIVIIAYALLIIYLAVKEKNLKFIFCKNFVITLPIYVCIFIYYIYMLCTYGTVQPTIQEMAFDYYKTTNFYNEKIYKKAYTFKMYAKRYWKGFINYWAGYNYGETFPKHELKEALISTAILITPILIYIYNKIKKIKTNMACLYICIGVYIAVLIQFIRQYIEFKTLSGYLGGYHSRYYLCAMPAFLMLTSKLIDEENMRKRTKLVVMIITVTYCVLIQSMLFI